MNLALLILLIGQWIMAYLCVVTPQMKGEFSLLMWLVAFLMTTVAVLTGGLTL